MNDESTELIDEYLTKAVRKGGVGMTRNDAERFATSLLSWNARLQDQATLAEGLCAAAGDVSAAAGDGKSPSRKSTWSAGGGASNLCSSSKIDG